MGRQILVAEDSPTQAERVRLLLEGAGYRVDLAANGQEALARVRHAPPDLIISDVVMPKLDGYAFCRAVKASELTRRIPFVLLTDRRSAVDVLSGLEHGADNFITKPFEDEYLLERVRRIFEHLELRQKGHVEVEVTVRAGDREIVINPDKQQIIELLFTTFDELHHANEQLREAQGLVEGHARSLEQANAELRVRAEIHHGYGELAGLLNSLDRSHILEHGTRRIAESLRAPLAAVYLTGSGPDGLRLKTAAGADPGGLESPLLSATGLPAEVARRGEALVVSLPHEGERVRLQMDGRAAEVAAVAGYPLIYRSRLLGVLVVATLEPLGEHGRGFLQNAARQLSIALSNAGLYESVRYQSQQLERLNADLQQASKVKSRFLASMSHELRTPLNAIIGFTDVLLMSARDPLAERQRTALERVRESGKHLLGLINEVLDLSKIEAGRLDIRPERVELDRLVRECLETVEAEAHAKGLDLGAEGLEGVPEIFQDGARVRQILLNLLSNAVKFTPAGAVRVRLAVGDGTVDLAVADTGIGIAAEHLGAIFEEFRQVDSAESRAAGGTGLGLAISRRLAELMGGTLTVESARGRGSVFTLRLPARYRAAAPLDEPDEGRAVSEGMARVLVIDDDRDAVEILRQALAGEPFRVEWASNAAEGLARAQRRRPTVIMLDVMLEGHDDGWDVLQALKANPATQDVPVVVHSVIDNRQLAERLGAADVLVKPAPLAAIRTLLCTLAKGHVTGTQEGKGERA